MITNQNQSINEWEPGIRYPHDVKLSILAELRTGLTQRAILKNNKISSGTLRTWIERFGPADMQCQKRLVTDQQRREGARAIIEGRMTITEVMEMHNLITRATVSRWVKDYKMEYAALATSNQNYRVKIVNVTMGNMWFSVIGVRWYKLRHYLAINFRFC